ncbi:MAG TPA: hypothetical protein VG693_01040, partial [Actinomycetes bacterium]|nr:hypothetical protein [Actinomycetes bacterium]
GCRRRRPAGRGRPHPGRGGRALQPGDRVITGSVVQVPVHRGDRVVTDLGLLGRVELTVAG